MNRSYLRRVAVATALFSGAVWAAPFASVPSIARVGQQVAVAGGGFAPGTVITARIQGPNQAVAMAAAAVAADGTLTISIVAGQQGAHVIELVDASGTPVVRNLRIVATP